MQEFELGLTFDDVALVPQYNNVPSRTEPNLSSWITQNVKVDMPLIPANMDTVIGPELAQIIIGNGGMPIFHRFSSLESQVEWVKRFGRLMFVSTGIGKLDTTFRLLEEGARGVCVDVAHGHSNMMFRTVESIKSHFPEAEVIAGNVCGAMAYQDLVNAGANAVKVGIGPGCFAAGTRVLMANATYKNIEDIRAGDRIITGEGIPATVKRAFKSGYKKVAKLRTNAYHKTLLVTADHNFLVGDLSSTSQDTIATKGYAKLLGQHSKTIPRQTKIRWMPIEELDRGCLLLPKIIQWEMPKHFNVELLKRSGGNWKTGSKYSVDSVLTPTYEVGYLFGTFLGDGTVHQSIKNGSHSGAVSWYFGETENHIVDKLVSCINKVFGRQASIKQNNSKHVNIVSLDYKPLADFLASFEKRRKKHLPEELIVDNHEYISGLWDGLIDSDGSISLERRVSFNNTSEQLIELFNVCTYILKGHFPNNEQRLPSREGLSNCNIENCSIAYVSRPLLRPEARLIDNYQVIKALSYENTEVFLDVYDLEIIAQEHSFIANNTIVHNSACTTRIVTGFGVPQFTAIKQCADVAKKLRVPIIADGGIRGSRDVVLALAAGASTVMIGKLFALTLESAAEKRKQAYFSQNLQDPVPTGMSTGGAEAKYRGQASEDFQKEFYGGLKGKTVAEGTDFWAPVTGTAQELIDELLGGLRSGLTYGGARNIKELQRKAEFMRVTSNYGFESSPRR